MTTDQVIDFVPLTDFDDYEILNQYPYTVRRKNNHRIISEYTDEYGYIRIYLNCKSYKKHVIIAKQFIPNDDPEHNTEIDHINHDKTDNRIENLRWVSSSKNNRNRSVYNGVQSYYEAEISDESMKVDFYKTINEVHEFEKYYYYNGKFYYDNDVNYRILNENISKSGYKYVNMRDINNKFVSVYIHKFLKQHDLI